MDIEDITLTQIQDFVVREVATSAEFAALSTSLSVGTVNFYRGADLQANNEVLPYFIAYKFNSHSMVGEDSSWMVQYVIGINSSNDPDSEVPETVTDADGILIYPATDKVEALAVKALGIIRQGISSGGIGGVCNLHIADANILITEVGEAYDVQAIVTLRLESYSTF